MNSRVNLKGQVTSLGNKYATQVLIFFKSWFVYVLRNDCAIVDVGFNLYYYCSFYTTLPYDLCCWRPLSSDCYLVVVTWICRIGSWKLMTSLLKITLSISALEVWAKTYIYKHKHIYYLFPLLCCQNVRLNA